MGTSHHLPHHGRGQLLLNLVGLRLIDEGGNRNRLNVGRKSDAVAGGVIAASYTEKQNQDQ